MNSLYDAPSAQAAGTLVAGISPGHPSRLSYDILPCLAADDNSEHPGCRRAGACTSPSTSTTGSSGRCTRALVHAIPEEAPLQATGHSSAWDPIPISIDAAIL